jgi:hypothetical protein
MKKQLAELIHLLMVQNTVELLKSQYIRINNKLIAYGTIYTPDIMAEKIKLGEKLHKIEVKIDNILSDNSIC